MERQRSQSESGRHAPESMVLLALLALGLLGFIGWRAAAREFGWLAASLVVAGVVALLVGVLWLIARTSMRRP